MVKFLISELINEGYRLGDIIVVRGERYVIIEPPPYSRDYGIFWYVIKLVPPAKRNTDLEKKTEQYLSELGFKEHEDYEKQYYVSGYWIDFAFVNEKVAVEPGADYWHTPEKDETKEKALNEMGWKVIWFNENDISQDGGWVKRIIWETIIKERKPVKGVRSAAEVIQDRREEEIESTEYVSMPRSRKAAVVRAEKDITRIMSPLEVQTEVYARLIRGEDVICVFCGEIITSEQIMGFWYSVHPAHMECIHEQFNIIRKEKGLPPIDYDN
jgi:very-short-patch-repair endonuclease